MDDRHLALEDLRRFPDWRDDLESMQAQAVYAGRNVGLSWAEIGQALGITQQAAHKRYAEPLSLLRSASQA